MASKVNENISINFFWEGPSIWRGGCSQGGLDVGVVDVIFKNAKCEISVHIPENLSIKQQLPFTCRQYDLTDCSTHRHKIKNLISETHSNVLKVTIEQIRQVTLRAGFFEESPYKRTPYPTNQGAVIYHQKHLYKSEKEIQLEVPEDLKIGQTYTVLVTSQKTGNFSLSARLIPEEAPIRDTSFIQKDDPELIQGKTELLQFLTEILLPLVGLRVFEFERQIMSSVKININENFGEQGQGLAVIKSQIDSIEKKELRELIGVIKILKTDLKNKSLEKETYKACLNAMGQERLANIMRSSLFALVQENISSEVQLIIDDMANGFKDYCIKEIE